MPLKRGYSKATIGHNIKKELATGKSMAQSVAIALNVAREASKKVGKKGPAKKKKKK